MPSRRPSPFPRIPPRPRLPPCRWVRACLRVPPSPLVRPPPRIPASHRRHYHGYATTRATTCAIKITVTEAAIRGCRVRTLFRPRVFSGKRHGRRGVRRRRPFRRIPDSRRMSRVARWVRSCRASAEALSPGRTSRAGDRGCPAGARPGSDVQHAHGGVAHVHVAGGAMCRRKSRLGQSSIAAGFVVQRS